MRPKRVILLYCASDDRRHELTFILETKGYRVVTEGFADLAIIVDSKHGAGAAVWWSEEMAADASCRCNAILVMLNHTRRTWCRYPANSMMVADSLPMAKVLDWVRLMTIRKRGPRTAYRAVTIADTQVVTVNG